MKKATRFLAITIAAVSLFACKKKNNTSTADNPPSAANFAKIMDNGFKSKLQTATFDASNTNFVYTSPKGTTVTIDGTCLRNNGASVSGQVTLEFFEAYERADMLVANKPTMGKNSSNGYELLESGGQFYVAVTQNSMLLSTTCKVKISTPAVNSGGIKTGMSAFDGVMTDKGLTWEVATQWEVIPDVHKSRYALDVPGFGFYNCDRFFNDPRPKTKLTMIVPKGYADVSSVYILAKSIPNALGGAYGDWPVGMECYFIFVTEKDGQYRWITKETTIVNNHTETFDLATAKTGSIQDYIGHVTLLK
jgi:hypothetical protein